MNVSFRFVRFVTFRLRFVQKKLVRNDLWSKELDHVKFSEIFNIARLRVLHSFSWIQEKLFNNLEAIVISKLTKHGTIPKKTKVYGCLQYGIKQTSVTCLVYDLEFWWSHILKLAEMENML